MLGHDCFRGHQCREAGLVARRAAKTDETHAEIRDALRKAGCGVFSLGVIGNGVPDLCVGYGGYVALVECKTGKRGLRESQIEFIKNWPGVVIVARTGEEAVREFWKAFGAERLAHGDRREVIGRCSIRGSKGAVAVKAP